MSTPKSQVESRIEGLTPDQMHTPAKPLVQIRSRREQRIADDVRIEQYHALRDKVAAKRGSEYWRSLEELADTPEFNEYLRNEFPEQASEWTDPVGRRRFMKLMGASLALAGIGTACAYQPRELIVPYIEQPEELVPGKPLFFATAMPGSGIGLLAKSNAGRPTKLEGNPDHPASLGATDIFAQAAILQLYDPDRSKVVLDRGEGSTYAKFSGAVRTAIEAQKPNGGAGIRFLTETVTSPTLARQMQAITRELPQARWIQYDPCSRSNAALGAFQTFGRPLNTIYRFDLAARILSLDSDFLAAQGSANLRYSRDWARARTPQENNAEINRLYAVEVTPTQTGAKADHRIPARPSEMEALTRTIAARLGVAEANGGAQYTNAAYVRVIDAMTRDLASARGRSIVIVGDDQPPAIHALGHAINAALGNVGQTVFYTDTVEANPTDQVADMRRLAADMNAGQVQMLVMVGGNPVYNAPADLNFRDAMQKVPLRAHLSLYNDETSRECHWHVPQTHFLEEWSDVRSFDGTVSIVQPLIVPLYDGKSCHEFVGLFGDTVDLNGLNIVKETYSRNPAQGSQATIGGAAMGGAQGARANQNFSDTNQTQGTPGDISSQDSRGAQNSLGGLGGNASPAGDTGAGSTNSEGTGAQNNSGGANGAPAAIGAASTRGLTGDFEKDWRYILHTGVVPNSGFQLRTAAVGGNLGQAFAASPTATAANGFDLVFRPDPSIGDGRFANNGWLQELPNPLTKITWDNAALVSPRTARERLGIDENDFNFKGGGRDVRSVRITHAGNSIDAPVFVVPGHPDDTVTLHLGHGRESAGVVGDEVGFNAYRLRTTNTMSYATGAQVELTGDRLALASTQLHFMTEDREPVRVNTIQNFTADPDHAYKSHHPDPPETMTMYPRYEYDYHKWGMVIDLNRCVGCNACVMACQSENNIPVVGKEQIARSREMHWLRIDSYYRGRGEETALDNPNGPFFQPLMCVHCEQAPCEPVCPVNATVHDAEGLNVMVYNRCVGTRYCSNNCPYKVRRFNFMLYQDWETPQYKMMRNPDVSIRSRGVMEKCTYCVQRIWWGKIEASKEGRRVADGEVVTACQSVCPTEAIIFGDTNDPTSRVSQLKQDKRDFSLLGELNTRPQTTYLGIVRNPNPELQSPEDAAIEHRNTPNTSSQQQNQGAAEHE